MSEAIPWFLLMALATISWRSESYDARSATYHARSLSQIQTMAKDLESYLDLDDRFHGADWQREKVILDRKFAQIYHRIRKLEDALAD